MHLLEEESPSKASPYVSLASTLRRRCKDMDLVGLNKVSF